MRSCMRRSTEKYACKRMRLIKDGHLQKFPGMMEANVNRFKESARGSSLHEANV